MQPRAYLLVCAWEAIFVLVSSFAAFFNAAEAWLFWIPVSAAWIALPGMLIAWVLGFAALAMLPAPFTRGLWVLINFFRTLMLAMPVLLMAMSLGAAWFGVAWAASCFAVSTPLYRWLWKRAAEGRIRPQDAT
jgi:hypothetical protein